MLELKDRCALVTGGSRGIGKAIARVVEARLGAIDIPVNNAGVGTRIPVGRVGHADEIAQALMFVVGDAYVTGRTLAVNGGGLFS